VSQIKTKEGSGGFALAIIAVLTNNDNSIIRSARRAKVKFMNDRLLLPSLPRNGVPVETCASEEMLDNKTAAMTKRTFGLIESPPIG
jgi:hypothetical protein